MLILVLAVRIKHHQVAKPNVTKQFRKKIRRKPNTNRACATDVESDRKNPKMAELGRRPGWETVRGLPINRSHTGPTQHSHARACVVQMRH